MYDAMIQENRKKHLVDSAKEIATLMQVD